VLIYETSDNDNDEARVRLKSEIVARHKEGIEETCAQQKAGKDTCPISLHIDIYVDRRTTGCPLATRAYLIHLRV